MREYQAIISDIQTHLNTRRNKETATAFKMCLKELAKNYKIVLSTKFLRGLISDEKNNRQKTFRLRYLLRQAGLKTKRENRYFKGEENKIRKIDIKEYGFIDLNKIDKTRITTNELNQIERLKPYELTEEERQQKEEIENIKNSCGIELYPYPEMALKERDNKRKWCYSYPQNQIVSLKKIRTQEVLNTFKIHEKEVFFLIEGF